LRQYRARQLNDAELLDQEGVRYRYYVSRVLAQGRKDEVGSVSRFLADEIESIVMDAIARLPETDAGGNAKDRLAPTGVSETPQSDIGERRAPAPDLTSARERVEELVDRILITSRSVEIRFARVVDPGAPSHIAIPWSTTRFRRKREVVQPRDGPSAGRPILIVARTKLNLNAAAILLRVAPSAVLALSGSERRWSRLRANVGGD
jgi:hypothetical protein